MAGVAGEHVGAHDQQADRRLARPPAGAAVCRALSRDAAGHARMIDADLGIFDGRRRFSAPRKRAARAVGVAVDEKPDHVGHVLFRAGEPILQRQEIGAHVLRRARNEAQQLREAGAASPSGWRPPDAGLPLPPRSCFSSAIGPLAGALMSKRPMRVSLVTSPADIAQTIASQCVAPRRERGQQRLEMVLHEQHRADDDVALGDVGEAALAARRDRRRIRRRRGCCSERPGISRASVARARSAALATWVHRDDDDPDGRGVSGRNGLWHRTRSRW